MTTWILRLSLLLLVVCLPMGHAAQIADRPKPVDLVVNISVGTIQNRAPAGLTVQLQDGFGTIQQEMKTDGSGMVQFRTMTGLHRLRIFGVGIQEYNGNVEIERVETRRVENVQVAATPSSARPPMPDQSPGRVPASRLRAPGKAREEFQRGSQALERKDWAEARKRFEAAITLYSDYDVAYNGLGVAAMGSGDSQAARQAFEKAISLNDGFSEAYRNLARISFAEHKYQEVDALLNKSLGADPLNAWALTYAAYAELLTRKFNEAIAHARKAHTLPHKGLASVHIVAARALEGTQQAADALAEYKLYLEEDPHGRDATRAREAIARLSNVTPR